MQRGFGLSPRWRLAPYRGYGFTAVCESVARVRRAAPQPGECAGINSSVRLFPGGAALSPGYGFIAVCGPVARTGAQRRLRGDMAAAELAQLDAALHHAQQMLPGPELAKPRFLQPPLQILNIVTLAVEHQADHAAAVRHVNAV